MVIPNNSSDEEEEEDVLVSVIRQLVNDVRELKDEIKKVNKPAVEEISRTLFIESGEWQNSIFDINYIPSDLFYKEKLKQPFRDMLNDEEKIDDPLFEKLVTAGIPKRKNFYIANKTYASTLNKRKIYYHVTDTKIYQINFNNQRSSSDDLQIYTTNNTIYICGHILIKPNKIDDSGSVVLWDKQCIGVTRYYDNLKSRPFTILLKYANYNKHPLEYYDYPILVRMEINNNRIYLYRIATFMHGNKKLTYDNLETFPENTLNKRTNAQTWNITNYDSLIHFSGDIWEQNITSNSINLHNLVLYNKL